MKHCVLVLLLLFSGCSLFEDKPNNATAFTSDQIVMLAEQVVRAQAAGVLSEADGDEFIDKLIFANGLLGDTSALFTDLVECEGAENKYQCIDLILQEVEGAL